MKYTIIPSDGSWFVRTGTGRCVPVIGWAFDESLATTPLTSTGPGPGAQQHRHSGTGVCPLKPMKTDRTAWQPRRWDRG